MRSHDYYVTSHDHHVRSHDPPLLLGTDNESIEVGIDDRGSQSAEFSNQLHEQFLHQLVNHSTQSWLVQQRAWRSYPPAKKYSHLEHFSCSCKIVVSGEKILVYTCKNVGVAGRRKNFDLWTLRAAMCVPFLSKS